MVTDSLKKVDVLRWSRIFRCSTENPKEEIDGYPWLSFCIDSASSFSVGSDQSDDLFIPKMSENERLPRCSICVSKDCKVEIEKTSIDETICLLNGSTLKEKTTLTAGSVLQLGPYSYRYILIEDNEKHTMASIINRIKCVICHEITQDPVLLPCQHFICRAPCLEQKNQNKNKKDPISVSCTSCSPEHVSTLSRNTRCPAAVKDLCRIMRQGIDEKAKCQMCSNTRGIAKTSDYKACKTCGFEVLCPMCTARFHRKHELTPYFSSSDIRRLANEASSALFRLQQFGNSEMYNKAIESATFLNTMPIQELNELKSIFEELISEVENSSTYLHKLLNDEVDFGYLFVDTPGKTVDTPKKMVDTPGKMVGTAARVTWKPTEIGHDELDV
uniref:RING-type domain-containing protein n=1 Tax=Romanomermis culicivorax TaxID=13658 RepID=A0A915HLU0_ROMCU